MKAAEPIAQQGLWDSFWEQQTHWQSAFLLKISGSSYLVVNLDKMNNCYYIKFYFFDVLNCTLYFTAFILIPILSSNGFLITQIFGCGVRIS